MKFNAIKGLIGAFAPLKTLLLTFLLAGCSSLPEEPNEQWTRNERQI